MSTPRKAAPSRFGDDRSMVEKAKAAFDGAAPDWILELAAVIDAQGLKATAAQVGYSASTLSYICNRRYPGDTAAVEGRVRFSLLAAEVDCPVLGQIPRDRCLKEQDEPFRATSAYRAQIYHACRNCPNARLKGAQNDQ